MNTIKAANVQIALLNIFHNSLFDVYRLWFYSQIICKYFPCLLFTGFWQWRNLTQILDWEQLFACSHLSCYAHVADVFFQATQGSKCMLSCFYGKCKSLFCFNGEVLVADEVIEMGQLQIFSFSDFKWKNYFRYIHILRIWNYLGYYWDIKTFGKKLRLAC